MNFYFLYILLDKGNKIYIGYTSDLKRRITEHNNKKVYTTKQMNNPALYYFEAYQSEEMAKNREKKLKQFGSAYVGLMKRIGLR